MSNPSRTDVLPIQEVVAKASPSAWLDGLVLSSRPGELTVVLLDGGVRTLTTGAGAPVGEPVAVHPVAELVAVGGAWFSARAEVNGVVEA